jgi:hypothetical protein
LATLIAIDVGTSGARASAFDADGTAKAEVRRSFPTDLPGEGRAEQDAARWPSAALSALKALVAGLDGANVAAIGTAQAALIRERFGDRELALDRHGLRAGPVFTGLAAYSLNLLTHPDPEYRAAARRWYREVIYLTARAQRWADLRENLADLAAHAHQLGLDHLLVENLVTDREPSTMALIENILAERSVARAPIQLCLDLGHPFASGAAGPDADPYAWLAHFGPRIAEVQLQQSDGLGDRHWPFTPEHQAAGRVDPGQVLDTLAAAGVADVLLILEVIPAFEADDRQVIADLRASADVWRAALAERGMS